MAPITTGIELTLSPIDAIKIEAIKIQTVGPRKTISFRILSIVPSISVPSFIDIISCRNSFVDFKKLIKL